VVLVSSLPVIVLGFGAALSHLLRGEDHEPESAPEVNPDTAPEPLSAPVPESTPEGAPASGPRSALESVPKTATKTRAKSAVKRATEAKGVDPTDFYAAELALGEVPSLRRIRADLHVGQPKAQAIQAELQARLVAPAGVLEPALA
jgi:hypothetical protein